MLSGFLGYCFTRTTCTVLGSISNFLPGGACGMFFTYPAPTTSLNVFGRRWCSKLYLRSAWVSSSNAAFRAASELPEPSATAGCSVAGVASVFSPSAGWLVETGFGREVSGDLPQPVMRTAMSNSTTRREGLPELDQNCRKIQ